jgi:hypothetical protein
MFVQQFYRLRGIDENPGQCVTTGVNYTGNNLSLVSITPVQLIAGVNDTGNNTK